jgi:hypothetical protein
MVSLFCMIVVLFFIVMSLVGPWYGMSAASYKVSMSLTSSTSTINGETVTTSYSDARKMAETNLGADLSAIEIFDITFYLVIFALVIAILTLIFFVGCSFNSAKRGVIKKLAVMFGVITFILALVSAFYFMFAFSSKMSTFSNMQGIQNVGFWYSYSISGVDLFMGPGFAWYLMLTAGVVALISVIFVFIDKQEESVSQNPIDIKSL